MHIKSIFYTSRGVKNPQGEKVGSINSPFPGIMFMMMMVTIIIKMAGRKIREKGIEKKMFSFLLGSNTFFRSLCFTSLNSSNKKTHS